MDLSGTHLKCKHILHRQSVITIILFGKKWLEFADTIEKKFMQIKLLRT